MTQQVAIIMLCLVAVTVFLLFFNRTLEYRGYGFYFWLCAGLMFASDRTLPTYKTYKDNVISTLFRAEQDGQIW